METGFHRGGNLPGSLGVNRNEPQSACDPLLPRAAWSSVVAVMNCQALSSFQTHKVRQSCTPKSNAGVLPCDWDQKLSSSAFLQGTLGDKTSSHSFAFGEEFGSVWFYDKKLPFSVAVPGQPFLTLGGSIFLSSWLSSPSSRETWCGKAIFTFWVSPAFSPPPLLS